MYSTAADVITYTGVKPVDLGLEDVAALSNVIDGWLEEIADLINQDRRRNFLTEAGGDPSGVRPLVHNCAKRMAANTVALAVLRRDSAIIQINDFSIKMVEDSVLTEDIRRDLGSIPRGRTDVTPVRFWRVRSAEELDDLDAG